MSAQRKWVIGIVSIVVVVALLACGIFFAWRYFFPGKPSVVIAAPPSNYQALEGDEVTVEARATGRSIVRVELWVDDGLVDSASSPSPQDAFSAALTWSASGVGAHTVEAKAYDARGQASDPAAIVLIVTSEVAEVTPTVTLGPSFETPTPTEPPPTATPTSPPEATPTATSPPPTATPTPEPTDTPTPTATPGPPVIEFFTADPETITEGDSSTLSWGLVSDATGVEIDQGIGGVGTPDSTVVSPATTTTYTMTAVGPGGTTTASVTVTVIPAGPIVHSEGWETIPGTWTFDLDEGVIGPAAGEDFWWRIHNAVLHERSLVPRNGATYSIRGPQAWGDVDYAECAGVSYSGATIQANQAGPNQMPGTTVICFKTSAGRMGKFRVEGYVGPMSNDLSIRWITWD